MCRRSPPTRMTTIASPQQSADLVASRQPSIVIAASGMATGGPRACAISPRRSRNPKHTVMFVGYQAAGTRGRLLVDGAKEIKLLGRVYPPSPARIERIDSMSAHARLQRDQCAGSRGSRVLPAWTYLVHGDPVALAAPRGADHNRETMAGARSAAHHERVEVG